MTIKKRIKLRRITALISCLLGTIIFGLYYLVSDSTLLFVGYGFIVLTGLVNIGVLIAILVKARKDNINRKRLLNDCGVMFLNIPVMLAYCSAAVILLGTMRITFIHKTVSQISDMNVVGYGDGHVDKLEVGQSKTVWIEITGDCSIDVNYLSNG